MSGQSPKHCEHEAEQQDLFRCDLTNWPVKDDIASMEFPIFSLSKNKDMEIREYRRGNKVVSVIPSGIGAATVFDKDLLLYIASQIIEAKNQGRPTSRRVIIDSSDFLLATERGDGRASFERIIDVLRRLKGTIIETNVPTGGREQLDGFGIIEDYSVLSERSRKAVRAKPAGKKTAKKTSSHSCDEEVEVKRVLRFEVDLSEWFYNGLLNFEVLTMDRGYFKLTRSIERRLYEISRKHCGDQAYWKIDIDALARKVGTKVSRAKFRDDLREVIDADSLLEYRMALDTSRKPDVVFFYTRNGAKLSKELLRQNLTKWYTGLERTETRRNANQNTRTKSPGIRARAGAALQPAIGDV